jgi:ketosteroid isomerase-like protein
MKTSTRLLGALVVLTASPVLTTMASGTDRARTAIESQARALNDATQRGDAAAVASLFTIDAKLAVPGAGGIVTGRAAIQKFWQAAVNSGMKGLSLTTDELTGNGELRFETGRYSARGANGAELGTGDYLIVWKKEGGTWKIHRDYAHSGAPPAAQAGAARGTPASNSANAAAPAGDRVALPANYRAAFTALGVAFNEGHSEITATYANAAAVSVERAAQLPYPEGAVFLMEFASGLRDGEGQLMRDPAGQVLKGEILHIDVMRRGRDPGESAADVHAGAWEFASYGADGSVAVASSNAAHCANCHRNAGAEQDFVFRQRAPLSR